MCLRRYRQLFILHTTLLVGLWPLYGQMALISDADIARRFVVEDRYAGEYVSENAITLREFGPNVIMTNGVVDPFFAKGGTQFFPTDRLSGKAKIYVVAVDFADLKGEVGVSFGLQRNVFRNQGSIFDLSDPQVIFESTFWGSNGLKKMQPEKFRWESVDPADDFKGMVQILQEVSLGQMEIEVECLNRQLAVLKGLDPHKDKWPWFHINEPMLGYAVQGPADCEDYRQFARLHQAAIHAAYREIPGLDIEDIDFIYTIVPMSAFGHRFGLQGGGGFDTSFSYNDQALLQRDSEFRHEPGVTTPHGRIVGSGVFGIKNLWPNGNPRSSVNTSTHEFLHGMGMIDDYYYNGMNENWGESSVGQKFGRDTQDLTAWKKFRTGWVKDDEVKVVLPGEKAILNIRALSSYAGDGGHYSDDPYVKTRMVLIPKEWRTRDTFGMLWDNGWNPQKEDYNWYDWFTNPWVGGETYAIKSFPSFYVLEIRKRMGADNSLDVANQGAVISMVANPTWETGNGGGGFKLCSGSSGLKEGAVWEDPNLGLTITVLESNTFFDKVEISYTGRAASTIHPDYPGPAKHVYQGVLTASDHFVTAGGCFTVDFNIFTLGMSAVNDIQSPTTLPTEAAPFNNGVVRVATPLGVSGGLSGCQMTVTFDPSVFEYVSCAPNGDFGYTADTSGLASGVLRITASGPGMVDKTTILGLNFKTKTVDLTGDYQIQGTITDVMLQNWRGQTLHVGDPGFDGVGTVKVSNGIISLNPLADLYQSKMVFPDYDPIIRSTGGYVHLRKEPRYTVNGRITCDTPGPAPGSFIGVESEVTLFDGFDQVVATTKSTWDGDYIFCGVPTGEGYHVSGQKPKYLSGQSASFAVVDNNITLPELQLDRLTFRVSGTIYGADESDGKGASPLVGADVYIVNIGSAYKVLGGPCKTDAQGRYEVDARVETWNRPFAAVAVKTPSGYSSQVCAGGLELNLGRLYGIDPKDFIYPDNSQNYKVGGGYNFLLDQDIVERNITLTKRQEVHLRMGSKSADYSYQLRTSDGMAVGSPVHSVGAENGDDILPNVPVGGPYYIEVSRPGYKSACTMPFSVNSTRVFLRNAFTSNTLDLVEADSSNLMAGRVVDAVGGAPLEGVEVVVIPYANNRGRSLPFYSDKAGVFAYPDTIGEKDIIFSKKGYNDFVLNIQNGTYIGVIYLQKKSNYD